MSIWNKGKGRDLQLWPLLSLLLIVVLAPTACLVWFMNRAIENERLAMLKTLEDAYRRELADSQTWLEQFWSDRLLDLDKCAAGDPGSMMFAECIRSGWAESAICYNGQGRLVYPASPVIPADQNIIDTAEWQEAGRLENEENDPSEAAKAFAAIARETNDVNIAARALQAQTRCLVQSADKEAAIELIAGQLGEQKYQHAVDRQGRLIVPNVQLMALQLINERDHPAYLQLADQLQRRLNDYNDAAMPGTQRRFLMKELDQLLPEVANLPLLPAEDLAEQCIAAKAPLPEQNSVLVPSPLPGVWQLAASNGRLLALWRTKTIIAQSASAIIRPALPNGVIITLRQSGEENPLGSEFNSIPVGKFLPNWQLTLSLIGRNATDVAANKRIAMYLWTGIIVIASITILAGFMTQVFCNQMRLARLKNDLVATVSHELKTPLSSIRLLVDTLLDEQSPDSDKTRDYLQLISKENARLSRLIDNFLAFSRMERNKHAFQFSAVSPAAIIDQAVEAVRERFQEPGCRLETDAAADLPLITADADALVTVVLNLLDNAYKYTGQEKHVSLRAYAENGNVCIAVTDNGIGLSRAAAKKIFQRFYQVDSRLSRENGGCGLGLSIVKFIVSAHGGCVEVASRPNSGSTFTVKLPRNQIV